MQFDTEISCNSVIWITSLPDTEQGPTRRMVEDMELLKIQFNIGLQHIHVKSVDSLRELIKELALHANKNKMRPLLHFDMHGGKDNGLYISQSSEFFSWEDLYGCLQELNLATDNNLVVVGAACFGLRSIIPIKLDNPAPFFVLLAPEQEVHVGFLEDNIPCFYRDFFTSVNLYSAYNKYLSGEFKYFHCEKLLFMAVAKYIRTSCKGKSAQKRKELLLTEVLSQDMENTEDNLKSLRKKIKEGLKPDQALLDRYASTFLISRKCSFNMEQLLSSILG
ncbi:TPA: hypothetical protein ACSP27_002398 [Aeromonas veronii]